MTTSRRSLIVVAAATVSLVMAGTAPALAYWGTTGHGTGIGRTDGMNSGNQPTATPGASQSIALTWTRSTTTAGTAVGGYRIARYSAATGGSATAATGGCSGTISGTGCTEAGVPTGTWYYSVTPVLSSWTGPESPRSTGAASAAAALAFANDTVAAGGAVSGGSLSGFGALETVTFRLDGPGGTILATTPSPVTTAGNGSQTGISATIPAGTSAGTHSIVATGTTSARQASTTVTVPALPPNAPSITFPVAAGRYNAASWTGSVTGGASAGSNPIANTQVAIRNATDSYWNGTSFAGSTLTWLDATTGATAAGWSYGLARLTDGTYTVQARSVDTAGTAGPVTSTGFTADSVAPSVSDVTLANGTGTARMADANDTITITFSEQMDASKFCSSWTNSGTQTRAVSANLTQNGVNDTVDSVVVTGTGCSPVTFGTVSSGGNYLNGSSSVTFASSKLTWDGTNKLILQLGGNPNSPNLVAEPTPAAPSYNAPAGLADLAGNALPAVTTTSKTASAF